MRLRELFESKSNISEVSSELLGRYKTAASAASTAADAAGDYEKGHKRYKGILSATQKQLDKDAEKAQKVLAKYEKSHEDVNEADDGTDSNAMILKQEVGELNGLSALSFEEYTDSEVEISNIETIIKGSGAGTKAMRAIIRAADKHGIDLMLIPAGSGDRRERLVDFYSRFGFEEDGDVMRRSAHRVPQSNQPQSEMTEAASEKEQAVIDAQKAAFKRQEMQHELGHEEEQERQEQDVTHYILINGKILKKDGVPYHYRGKQAAYAAARSMMTKDWNKGKSFHISTKPEDDAELIAAAKIKPQSAPSKKEKVFTFFDIARGGKSFTDDQLKQMGLIKSTSGKWYAPTDDRTIIGGLEVKLNVRGKTWKPPVKESGSQAQQAAIAISKKQVDEKEGTPEGLPHLTKEMLQHIIKQVGTEGAHAIVKSLEWGDGAAKELLAKIVHDLKQEVTEGRVDNPVSTAITRRILNQRPGLLKYGPQAVMDAVDEVASWVDIGPDDEIGTSDVSGWVDQVATYLYTRYGMPGSAMTEAKSSRKMKYKRRHIPSGRIYIGAFNGTHHYCFGDEDGYSDREKGKAADQLVSNWNRQQPTEWNYSRYDGDAPVGSEMSVGDSDDVASE